MQRADVRRWKGQACEIVVCAGGLKDSGEAVFFAEVVLVQLGLCAKMIDEILRSSAVGVHELEFEEASLYAKETCESGTGHNANGQRHAW